MNKEKLCYIEGNFAYFTTQDLKKQWGDDWNDAPMDCNAGPPYEWAEHRNVPFYKLVRVAFYCFDLEIPHDVSVQAVNRGAQPWLFTWDYKVTIPAGVTIEEFKALVREAGGEVFVSEEAD